MLKISILIYSFLVIVEIKKMKIYSQGSSTRKPKTWKMLSHRINFVNKGISRGSDFTIQISTSQGSYMKIPILHFFLNFHNNHNNTTTEGYLGSDNPYFGATVGRVANRIAKGRFTVDGVEYKVGENRDGFSLHGGFKGWNAKVWKAEVVNGTVVMSLLSEDNDEGYPGAVSATTVFKFDDDGTLTIEMKATTTKATPINLTNHSYFNIAGHVGYFNSFFLSTIKAQPCSGTIFFSCGNQLYQIPEYILFYSAQNIGCQKDFLSEFHMFIMKKRLKIYFDNFFFIAEDVFQLCAIANGTAKGG